MEISSNWDSVLNIFVTWFCPNNCKYCYLSKQGIDKKGRKIININLLKKELKKVKSYGFKEIRLSGGEPLSIGEDIFVIADLVKEITGKKPYILTSGLGINKEWIKKAKGKFYRVYISFENPYNPQQFNVNQKKLLRLIKIYKNTIPFRYGLTLLDARNFKNIPSLFQKMYLAVDKKFMPQFGYACHEGTFVPPTKLQLKDLEKSTERLFKRWKFIPFYFSDFVGPYYSQIENKKRFILNITPEGIYSGTKSKSLRKEINFQIKKMKFLDGLKCNNSCNFCEWNLVCNYILLQKDKSQFSWCGIRKAIFNGMYKAFSNEFKKNK